MLADLLKTYLATTYAYTIKGQYFHWNVEGPDFSQLHTFFQKIYEDSYSAIDPIAEFVRTIDEYAPGSLERFQELSKIAGQTRVPRARLMLEELLVDTAAMVDMSKTVFDAATSQGRDDIANFAADRMTAHGTYAWQLRSFLKDARA